MMVTEKRQNGSLYLYTSQFFKKKKLKIHIAFILHKNVKNF